MLGWPQDELARVSEVAKKTIADFEREARTPFPRTLRDIRLALEEAGIVFIAADRAGGTGVRFRKPTR